MKKLLLVISVTTLFAYCTQPADSKDAAGTFSLDSAKAAITAANNVVSAAMAKDDSVAAASVYAKDACMMQSGMPKICGTAAITSFFGSAKKMGVGGIKINTLEVTGGKELVSEEGSYELLGLDGKTIDKGKYIVTWKQEDGKWKIARDISNTDMPPTPPPAEKK